VTDLSGAPSTDLAVAIVTAWSRVARVSGPDLGDARKSLAYRCAVFGARLRMFRGGLE